MRKVLMDYDGILIDTELAKAARWYFVAMMLCRDEEITEEFMEAIARRDENARLEVERLVRDRDEDLKRAMKHAGGTRLDFAMRVWREFLGGEPTEEEVKEKMFPPSEKIRKVLIDWLSVPIWGNLRFFYKLYAELRIAYWDDHPLGLVTQTESKALHEQFELRNAHGSSLWGEFREFLSVFGEYEPDRGFPFAECAGDYKNRFPNLPHGKEKATAYTILCGKLGICPKETITFEDTKDGVRAAKEAGIACIGVRGSGSTQDLSEADLIIEGSLEQLMKVTDVFVMCKPQDALAQLRHWLTHN